MKHESWFCSDFKALFERHIFLCGGRDTRPELIDEQYDIFVGALEQFGVRNHADLVRLMARYPVLFFDVNFET